MSVICLSWFDHMLRIDQKLHVLLFANANSHSVTGCTQPAAQLGCWETAHTIEVISGTFATGQLAPELAAGFPSDANRPLIAFEQKASVRYTYHMV